MYNRIKWGWTYNIGVKIKINEIIRGLDVLENSSIGGYLDLTNRKSGKRIYVLKNQNSSEWWFELFIETTSIRLINMLEKTFTCNKEPSIIHYSTYNKSFIKQKRFIIGCHKEKISQCLGSVFIDFLGNDPKSKIYLKFSNVEVEKGLNLG